MSVEGIKDANAREELRALQQIVSELVRQVSVLQGKVSILEDGA